MIHRVHHHTCSPEAVWHFTSNFNPQHHLGVIIYAWPLKFLKVIDVGLFLPLAPSSSSLKFHFLLGWEYVDRKLVLAKVELIPIYPLGLSQRIHSHKQHYFVSICMSFASDFYFILNMEYENISARTLVMLPAECFLTVWYCQVNWVLDSFCGKIACQACLTYFYVVGIPEILEDNINHMLTGLKHMFALSFLLISHKIPKGAMT